MFLGCENCKALVLSIQIPQHPDSCGCRSENNHRGVRWYECHFAKSAIREQTTIFIECTLSPRQHDQHVEIHERSKSRLTGSSKQQLDNGDMPARTQPSPAVAENTYARRIVPVVKYVFEEIEVGFRYGIKEIASDDFDSLAQASLLSCGRCARDHIGQVDDNALKMRIGMQN